ncbi:MAG: hypothetical protein IPM83_02805 [Ignavibacteria bacterium]|nr:hypothetical protein [Ignavibacteria bacterium]
MRTVTPPALRFQPTAVAERGMASWTIMASQEASRSSSLTEMQSAPYSC